MVMDFPLRVLFTFCVTTLFAVGCVAPTAEGLVQAGQRALMEGDLGKALSAFDDAVRVKPNYADAYTGRGIVYLRRGDYGKAFKEFDEALRLDPDSAEAYSGRGYAAAKTSLDFSSAYTDTRKAVMLQPRSAVFRSRYAYALACLGMFKDAEREAKRSLELDEGDAEVWFNYGAVLALKGERKEALAKLKKAFLLAPQFEEVAEKDRDFKSCSVPAIK